MIASRFTSALFVATLLFSAMPSQSQQPQAQPQARLAAPIANASRAALAGSQPPRARIARDLGAVASSTPLQSITMHFSRTAQQQADLDALIAAQQDPSSPQYHQWLTPTEFGARFGVADVDIAKTETWLESQGFTVQSVSPSRNSITFSGAASAVGSAFGAPLHHYSLNGENHIAPSADLTLPSALAGIVSDIRNLSDFRPRPHVRYGNGARFKPNFTSSQTGNHFLTPGDVAVIYDIKAAYSAGYNGTGQTIAVMGQSAIVNSDVTNFQTAIGQPAKQPTSILVPNTGASQVYSGDESESDLDVEYVTGIAPGATIEFVYVGANATASVFDSLTYAIQNRVAPILNISYGECEANLGQTQFTSLNSLLQQASAQGQTIVSAAGDDGSTDCYGTTSNLATEEALGVDFPSSSQYVTAVGGTEFLTAYVASSSTTYFSSTNGADGATSALSYIPEMAWNDDSASFPSSPLSAGGGGASMFTPAPTWQTGVPGIPSGSAFRLVPDIALDASPNNASYAYCSSDSQSAWVQGQQGSCTAGLRDSVSQDLTVAGGTSFSAPIFAGMVAILSQARGYTYQGLVSPTLYKLASNATTYASAFHDITTGSNACNIGTSFCSTAGAGSYSATVGYDEATGLGSVDLNNLLNAWPASSTSTSSPYFSLTATSVSVSSGSSATSTVTITPQNGYPLGGSSTINWTVAPTTLPNSCYSISSTKITSSAAVTATLSIQAGSSICASGFSPLTRAGTGTSASLHKPAIPNRTPLRAPAPLLASLGLIASIALFRRRRNQIPALLAVIFMAGMSLGLAGCGGGTTAATTGTGGGGGTTPPVTNNYSVTLIGKDSANGNLTAQATFTVTLTSQ